MGMQGKRTLPVENSQLTTAWEALRRGEREYAHQLSTQILGVEPDNTDAWLLYAKSAATIREEFLYLNQAQQFFPDNPRFKAVIYQEMKNLLDQDPFLAYQGETEDVYQVFSREAALLNIPKERARPEPFPTIRPPKIQKAYHYLVLAIFGLILSGLGAVVFGPVAVRQAWEAMQEAPGRADRARARLILGLAVCMTVAGLLLVYLLWLHIQG